MRVAAAVVILAILAPALNLFLTVTALPTILAEVGGLAWRLLPARPRAVRRDAAPFGRLLLVCAAVLALAFVANAEHAGARAALLLGMIAAVAAALALDARAPARLFPSGMLSLRRPIGQAFWTIFLVVMSVSPVGIYMSLLLQRVHGASPAVAGYVFAGHSLAWTAAAIVTARIPARRVRSAIVAGPFIVAAGLGVLFCTITGSPLSAVAVGILMEGMGIGTCWAHIGSVVFASARPDEQEATAALVPSTQLFAISFGSAVSGVVASAVGLTRDASPAVAAATGEALFGAFAGLAVAAGAIAMRLAPTPPER